MEKNIAPFPPLRDALPGVLFWEATGEGGGIKTSRQDVFAIGNIIAKFSETRAGKETSARKVAACMGWYKGAALGFYSGELVRLYEECPYKPGDTVRLKKSLAGGDTLEVEMVAGFMGNNDITYALVGKLTKKKGGTSPITHVALKSAIAEPNETREEAEE